MRAADRQAAEAADHSHHHSPLVTRHSPLSTHHSPLTAPSLTTHHAPRTTHHALPTAHCPGKLRKLPTSRYVVGFCALGLLATLCLWLGRNKILAPFGISYAVYAIFLGMVVGNVRLFPRLNAVVEKWLQPVAKDGEFMIKIALVLYAKSYRIIGQVGPP